MEMIETRTTKPRMHTKATFSFALRIIESALLNYDYHISRETHLEGEFLMIKLLKELKVNDICKLKNKVAAKNVYARYLGNGKALAKWVPVNTG